MKKKIDWNRVIYDFVFITLLLSVIFLVIRIALAPMEATGADVRIKSDYVLMLVQCILGVVAMRLPNIIEHKLQIPSRMLVLYAIFLYCAIYLGEVRAFYYNVRHWDTILHTFSGGMLGALGLLLRHHPEQIGSHSDQSVAGVCRRIRVLFCGDPGRFLGNLRVYL